MTQQKPFDTRGQTSHCAASRRVCRREIKSHDVATWIDTPEVCWQGAHQTENRPGNIHGDVVSATQNKAVRDVGRIAVITYDDAPWVNSPSACADRVGVIDRSVVKGLRLLLLTLKSHSCLARLRPTHALAIYKSEN